MRVLTHPYEGDPTEVLFAKKGKGYTWVKVHEQRIGIEETGVKGYARVQGRAMILESGGARPLRNGYYEFPDFPMTMRIEIPQRRPTKTDAKNTRSIKFIEIERIDNT